MNDNNMQPAKKTITSLSQLKLPDYGKLNFLDLVDYLNISRVGNKIFSIFKEETNPSMHIYPESQTYKCYSTGEHGNIIKFYMVVKNASEEEAARDLTTIYQTLVKEKKATPISPPRMNNLPMDSQEYEQKKDIQSSVFEDLYYCCISEEMPDEVKNYLTGPKRKLSEKTIRTAKIFYVSDVKGVVTFLKRKFSKDELTISGLFKDDYFIFSNHRLIIPYFRNSTYYSNTETYFKYLRGRYFENGNDMPPAKISKYIGLLNYSNSLGTKRFYQPTTTENQKSIKDSAPPNGYALICEGEFDSLIADQITGSVSNSLSLGILGVTNIPQRLLPNLHKRKIYVCFDNDNAGRRATYEFAKMFMNPIYGVFLKNHKDLTEWYNGQTFPVFEDTENAEVIEIFPDDKFLQVSATDHNSSASQSCDSKPDSSEQSDHPSVSDESDVPINNKRIPSETGERSNLLSANKLLGEDIPEPNWFIKNFLMEGLTILAGKPKTGKSWLALNISFSVAQGKKLLNRYYTEQHEVLYLAYEDTKRRLKKRIIQLMQSEYYYCDQVDNIFFPDQLHLKNLNTGGLEELEKLVTENNKIKVVIIDTFGASFVPPKKSVDTFQENYQMILMLQKFAMKYSIAVILIHHLKKMKGELAQDGILGSTGITAACDSTMILEVDKDKNAVIEINGRDVLNERIAVEHDQETGVWELRGEETDLTIERQTILDIFKAEPERIFQTKDIAELTNTSRPNASKLLKKLAEDGFIERVKSGKYILAKKKEEQVE